MDRQCCVPGRRESEISDITCGRGVAPGLRISEDGLVDRVGREVVIVFDDDGLVGLCDYLSVRCDFDHLSGFVRSSLGE